MKESLAEASLRSCEKLETTEVAIEISRMSVVICQWSVAFRKTVDIGEQLTTDH